MLRVVCAILNKHGKGELYFGVKNNSGEISGQQIGVNTLRDISKAIADNIKPVIYPVIKAVKKGKTEIIKVLFKGNNKLYHAYGRAYMRMADESRLIAPEEHARILKEKIVTEWERSISDKKLKDINVKALKDYIKRANEAGRLSFKFSGVKAALNKLGIIKNGKLLKAAEMLFCDDNSSELKAAVFAGYDKLTFLDIKQFKGCLFTLLNDGTGYIKEHMNWRADLTGQRRVEIPEVPLRAVTEAVVNSLCHRDYESPQSNEIAFYKDRIVIYNSGTFPENMTPQDYIDGNEPSRSRNPLIAGILYYSKDIEKWGSGLKRISQECKDSGVQVKFEILKTGYHIIFYRDQTNLLKTKNSEGAEFGDKFGDKPLLIVKMMSIDKNISIPVIADKLKISSRAVEKLIAKLRKKGIIERVGSAKGGYWKVNI